MVEVAVTNNQGDDVAGSVGPLHVTSHEEPWEIGHWPILLDMCPKLVKSLSASPKDSYILYFRLFRSRQPLLLSRSTECLDITNTGVKVNI